MTPLDPESLDTRLRENGAPEPPADLAERIKAEIPERPSVVPLHGSETGRDADAEGSERRGASGWLIAATVAVAAIGVSLTLQMTASSPAPAAYVVRESEVAPGSAGRADARSTPAAASKEVEAPGGEGRESAGPEQGSAAPEQARRTPLADPPPSPATPSTPSEPAAGEERSRSLFRIAPPSEKPAARPGSAPERQQPQSLARPGSRNRAEAKAPPAEDSATRSVTSESPLLEERIEVESSERKLQALGYLGGSDSSAAPSTGGTAEPNDAPVGDMFFESYGVNPFIDTEDDRLSTFALDVDTGAYTVARAYIEAGHLPPRAAVRVEEMVNFFDSGDAPPEEGDFAIRLEGAPTPFAEGPRYRLLRVGLKAREIAAADRKPATLVFVIDVSGSMDRQNRLGLVKRSLGLLLDQLREDDRVGLVVYGSRGEVLLEPTGDHRAIRAAIDRLAPGGSTNAEEGLVLGYRLAERHFRDGAINRLVLCSDGVANVGRTGPDSILERIARAAERGIELTTVGFGMGNYNDVLMERLADKGDGSYAYVDSLDEARRIFVDEVTGTLETIAREAKVQVEFDPSTVTRYRLLGYENRDVADQDFRNDAVDAGEIGAGHAVTALYEVKLAPGAKRRAELATVRLRYHSVAAGEVVETARSIQVGDLAPSWEAASPALRLASLVAEFAEILRGSYWAREGDLGALFERAQRLSADFAGDVDVAELVGLVGRAERLVEAGEGR